MMIRRVIASPLLRRQHALACGASWRSASAAGQQTAVNNNQDDADFLLLASVGGSVRPCSQILSRSYHATCTTSKPLYSMADLKELRASTGAPVVECKKALDAVSAKAASAADSTSDDDNADSILQAAMDWLRQHGAAKASSKVADRATVEGLVSFATVDGKKAVLVKVASETDFASRSDKFVQLVEQVTMAALTKDYSDSISPDDSPTVLDLSKQEINDCQTQTGDKSVKELMDEAIVAIRENISVASVLQLQAQPDDGSMWVGYVHNRIHNSNHAGTAVAAVLVAPASQQQEGENSISPQELMDAGKKLAMHVVAARPQYMASSNVPEDVLEKERDILQQQIGASSGKPPEIVAKIVQGRMGKFYEQVCFLEQGHMVEEKNPKVGAFLKERGIELKQFQALFIS